MSTAAAGRCLNGSHRASGHKHNGRTAARKCDRERPGRGARLLDEGDGTILRIARAPQQGSPYLFGTRRFVLQRFPYSTVYLTMSDVGHVLAVAHHRRKPGYWRRRLRDT